MVNAIFVAGLFCTIIGATGKGRLNEWLFCIGLVLMGASLGMMI